jgi:hypothetical protein
MESSKSQKKKDYYKAGMQVLFKQGEDFRTYKYALEEYRTALLKRKEIIKNLFHEVKLIKKLKV